jgi:peptide chain release factor 3
MDPRHRDRVAFVRVCSGEFARDMTVRNSRTNSTVRLSRAMRLFASDRESLDAAYAGDVVGFINPGAFAIGDTLFEGQPVTFPPIPSFAPEHFVSLRSMDSSGYKSFGKGISQLREEGAVQVFYPWGSPHIEPILGAVGELQVQVATYRLETEYNAKTIATSMPYTLALHVEGEPDALKNAKLPSNAKLVEDYTGRPVALFESEWSVRLAREWNPNLRFEPFGMRHDTEALAS